MQQPDNEIYRLVVRRGPQPNQTFELNKDVVTLGRDITNDIVINDPEVSRHHLRLTRGLNGYNIEDLGSTNGTFISTQRLTGVRPLNRGDIIGLGETVTLGYEVVRRDAAGAPTVPGAQPSMPPGAATPPPSPYAPSAGQPAQAPSPQYGGDQPPGGYAAPSPYAQPGQPQQPGYGQPAQQPGYVQPPQQPAYGQPQPQPQPYAAPSSGYGGYPPQAGYDQGQPQPEYAGYGAPQAPPAYGYDEDPYAVRGEEPQSAFRWIAIGCLLLSVFCCCSTIFSIVVIDALNLWYDLPIVSNLAPLFEQIAKALGLI